MIPCLNFRAQIFYYEPMIPSLIFRAQIFNNLLIDITTSIHRFLNQINGPIQGRQSNPD